MIVEMSARHRDVLRSKRPELLRNVVVSELLLSRLMSDGAINQTTKEEIDVSRGYHDGNATVVQAWRPNPALCGSRFLVTPH